jgi:transcription antitermination protein NusB
VRKSRRKAREAALQVLYEVEIGKTPLAAALRDTLEAAELPDDLRRFAEELVNGVREHQAELDDRLSALITEWDLDRIAAVDRNMLRIGAFELLHLPGIPPAVTINEAIEISRKYSTAESGKFVNGILGKLLENCPKASWNPSEAPPEELEEIMHEPPIEPELEVLDAESEEAKRLSKVGGWRLRAD